MISVTFMKLKMFHILEYRLFLNLSLVLCEFHILHPNPTHLPLPFTLPFHPCYLLCNRKNSPCRSCSVPWCVPRYSLCPYSLLNKVHCTDLSVWFEASGFCYFISTGTSLGLLLAILLSPCVMEILHLRIVRTGPFMGPNHPLMIEILEWDNSEPWFGTWVVGELVSPLALPYPHHQGELSSSALARPLSAAICRMLPSTGGRVSPPLMTAYLHPLLQSQLRCAPSQGLA